MSSIVDHVLVIDDDAVFNRVLCRALKRRGYPVSGVHSGEEALALAAQEQPTMIVLDLNLAGKSGLALVTPLRGLCPDARIVVLTGYASIATAVEAIKLGANQYLAKPVEIDTLLHALSSAPVDPGAKTAIDTPPSMPLSVERMEWEHIQRILLENNCNVSATARALNMHRRTLQRKLGKRPKQL
ncbi:MAG: response regulator transcription factor [Proteobacteria bacterium]|nr:response regulator transcription factor [Pseudomonadota bacterium]